MFHVYSVRFKEIKNETTEIFLIKCLSLNALILSVDEKHSIQALERKIGYIEKRDKKFVYTYKSTYKRHGALNLFSALNLATGHIKAQIDRWVITNILISHNHQRLLTRMSMRTYFCSNNTRKR